MRAALLPTSGDPGIVWRVGYMPDPWRWSPWEYATDAGRFNGRWDDQDARFRTLYTAESLLGCFLELLAVVQPNTVAYAELDEIVDDAGIHDDHASPHRGEVEPRWLEGRCYGSGYQRGRYAEITEAGGLAFLRKMRLLDGLGIPAADIDTALLKDSKRRDVTRSIARFIFELVDANRRPMVDGIAFRSRMGDNLRLWAVFERGEGEVSELIQPHSDPVPVTADDPTLLEAFSLLELHWKAED